MSKYESLTKHLARANAPELTMTFAQVEEILGASLPASARTHRPWWANSAHGHVQSKGWLDAGYQSEDVDLEGQKLRFKKVQNVSLIGDSETQEQKGRHPLIGWAKGTVKVAEGVDLTAPMFTDAEMDAWADEKAARIAAGMPK
jgi:hypothetical protein